MYVNFIELINDIKQFVKSNNCKIVQYDKPLQLEIGYKDEISGKIWSIGIRHIKESIKDNNLLKVALSSAEGKENLIKSFNKNVDIKF